MKRIPLLLLGSLALVAASCAGASNALAQKTPKQVLASAVAAAKKSGSYHFKLIGKVTGRTESIVGDASATAGREVITINTFRFELEVIKGKAFVEGNAGGLQNEMGLPAAAAQTYAGRWISIASTDAPYRSIANAVTVATAITEVTPSGHLSLTPVTTQAGQSVLGVRGSVPGGAQAGTTGTSVLYVSTVSPTVPLVYSSQESSNTTRENDTGTFTSWGTPVHLTVPTNAVPLSALSAGAG